MSMSEARPKKADKLDLMLDEAAKCLNTKGISGTSLKDVATRLGLTRAAVYYYVKDREDLVYQCYRRTCAVKLEDLAAVTTGTGLERLLAFLSREVSVDRSELAVLSEIAYLDGERRADIEAQHAQIVRGLSQIITDGIGDGSIRSCDVEINANCILGIISWVPLSPRWGGDASDQIRRRANDALRDLILNGTAVSRAKFMCPLDIADFRQRPGNLFNKDEASAYRVEQLLQTASQLFSERGIEATSLDEITSALGATKGALYHYVQDKSDLVWRCFERSFALFDAIVEASEKCGANGVDKGLIGTHLNVQAQVIGISPLLPAAGIDTLPEDKWRELMQRANNIAITFTRWAEEGVAEGIHRGSDYATIALLGAGAFGWISKWAKEEDSARYRAIADEITEFFQRGLKADGDTA